MQLRARRARARRRAALLASASSLAAAAAVMLLWLRPPAGPLRMKGGGVNVLRERQGVVTTLGPDDRIRAGDALELSPTGARSFAAWAVDTTGRVDPLTDGVVQLAAGATLPSSAVVEAPCRDLWIVVADEAHPAAEVAAQVARHQAGEADPPGLFLRRLLCE